MEVPGLGEERDRRRAGLDQQPEVGVVLGADPRRRVLPKAVTRACGAAARARGEELLVLRVRARPAALDVVDAELVQPPSDLQLVLQRQRDPGALAAVAQGAVVDRDPAVQASTLRPRAGSHKRPRQGIVSVPTRCTVPPGTPGIAIPRTVPPPDASAKAPVPPTTSYVPSIFSRAGSSRRSRVAACCRRRRGRWRGEPYGDAGLARSRHEARERERRRGGAEAMHDTRAAQVDAPPADVGFVELGAERVGRGRTGRCGRRDEGGEDGKQAIDAHGAPPSCSAEGVVGQRRGPDRDDLQDPRTSGRSRRCTRRAHTRS